jgi:hypothetical protein
MNSTHPCWCGQTDLAEFSPEYLRCENCQTLVLTNWPPAEQFDVVHDASDFYGRRYYESHLNSGLRASKPGRASAQRPERAMYALDAKRFKVPAAACADARIGERPWNKDLLRTAWLMGQTRHIGPKDGYGYDLDCGAKL